MIEGMLTALHLMGSDPVTQVRSRARYYHRVKRRAAAVHPPPQQDEGVSPFEQNVEVPIREPTINMVWPSLDGASFIQRWGGMYDYRR